MAEAPRVLLITSRFFLLGEIMTAFDRMGVRYRYLDTGGDELGLDEYLRSLITAIKELRPHFALTVNHLGVDHEGLLTGLLSKLDIPLASWFVDNPALALALYANPAAKKTAVFTWDADNLEPLGAQGFDNVFYLPLAADERRFVPPDRPAPPDHPWRAKVSFVGNSMVVKTAKRLEYANPGPQLLEALPTLAEAFGQHPEWSVRAFMAGHFAHLMPAFEALATPQRQLAFETAVIWESTRQYRALCLGQVMEFSPLIAGDEGWLLTFPDEGTRWRRLSELAYYDELPGFYPHSDVNFNCTSLQMKGAVNQRVFDVPACGAFLLTDHRAQMERLFEPGREVAVYGDPQEIPELVRHYLAHPEERARIARAARKRVLAEHTYVIRMGQLLDVMKRTFG
ncbi:CgeB family protein [Fundidesulfovibrio putealis]|uniref:CgeB family protein n=1 Tax=Fundidesulfovibrio putealis TaxID=270496 RepID=UPI000480C7CF|nr:glycosyltransferase [Fundidesulfovibrio putealis]